MKGAHHLSSQGWASSVLFCVVFETLVCVFGCLCEVRCWKLTSSSFCIFSLPVCSAHVFHVHYTSFLQFLALLFINPSSLNLFTV